MLADVPFEVQTSDEMWETPRSATHAHAVACSPTTYSRRLASNQRIKLQDSSVNLSRRAIQQMRMDNKIRTECVIYHGSHAKRDLCHCDKPLNYIFNLLSAIWAV